MRCVTAPVIRAKYSTRIKSEFEKVYFIYTNIYGRLLVYRRRKQTPCD